MTVVRYYHASSHRYKIGEPIWPGRGMAGPGVYLTTSPVPHYTLEHREDIKYVYEVTPTGRIEYDECWDDIKAEGATVLRCVGTVRGILTNRRKHYKEKNHFRSEYSTVNPRQLPREVRKRGKMVLREYGQTVFPLARPLK